MKLTTVIFSLLLLFAAGCNKDEMNGSIIEAWSPEILFTIPDTLNFDGSSLIIEASLNRDFMPMSPPNGRPMTAIITLVDISETNIPSTFDNPTLFVINGQLMWAVTLESRASFEDLPFTKRFYAREGPKWGPGIDIDAIFRFKDGSGDYQQIIIRDVRISESS